jgi:excisionase family DNA binding protein
LGLNLQYAANCVYNFDVQFGIKCNGVRLKSSNQANLQTIFAELQALRPEIRTARKRLLPIPEAAEYLGISARTIQNDLNRKVFPVKPVRYRGKFLFRREDLDFYIDGLGAGE